jgi:hypothetical protein
MLMLSCTSLLLLLLLNSFASARRNLQIGTNSSREQIHRLTYAHDTVKRDVTSA